MSWPFHYMNPFPWARIASKTRYCEVQYRKTGQAAIDAAEEIVGNIIGWNILSIYYDLPEWFIEKWATKLNWADIAREQILSESFIEKFSFKLNWEIISQFQRLSESFIEKHSNEVNMKC